jgi:hypothetical protein
MMNRLAKNTRDICNMPDRMVDPGALSLVLPAVGNIMLLTGDL